MNPDELTQLKRDMDEVKRFMRSFLSSAELSPEIQRTIKQVAALKLSDLADVDGTDSASTGTVLKKTASTWQPGTDNT